MEATKNSSEVARVAWSMQHPQVAFWKKIIGKCYFTGRIIMPVLIIIFMIIYWTYAVAVYNKN